MRGTRKNDNTPVAIKCIERGKDNEIKVYKEVVIMSKLKDYQFIISFHDFFHDDQLFYIVMDFREGGDLRDGIKKREKYSEMDARILCKKLLEGINYCHKNNVAHLDVKPQNVFIKGDGITVSTFKRHRLKR